MSPPGPGAVRVLGVEQGPEGELDNIAPKGVAAGTRYPEASMKVLNR
ncbi:hypothetical protein [Cystobacter ferrugineus]|nr:hypothetical protein [Cystobacter ferrugineus]